MTKSQKTIITIISVAIPLAVGALFRIKLDFFDFSFLPPFYAGINALTAICLITALLQIKKKNIERHEFFIKAAMVLSAIFLVCYVLYHLTTESTVYGGEGMIRNIYFFVLLSHIGLSMIIIPFVLISYVYGKARNIEKHKKMVKWAFPMWLYVALSGVIVYLMISPYYA
jgi:putative membrane protein